MSWKGSERAISMSWRKSGGSVGLTSWTQLTGWTVRPSTIVMLRTEGKAVLLQAALDACVSQCKRRGFQLAM